MKTLSIPRNFVLLTRACVLGVLPVAALLLAPSPSFACKCAPPPAPAEALQQATAVFEGQVSQIDPVGDAIEVTLRVVRGWKGIEAETARVRTRRDTAACGIPFENGKSYVVYATQSATEGSAISLEALRCGRTRLAEEAEEDFNALGLGVVPVVARVPGENPTAETPPAAAPASESTAPPKPAAPAAGGCAGCSAGGASSSSGPPTLWWIAMAALLILRRRRALSP